MQQQQQQLELLALKQLQMQKIQQLQNKTPLQKNHDELLMKLQHLQQQHMALQSQPNRQSSANLDTTLQQPPAQQQSLIPLQQQQHLRSTHQQQANLQTQLHAQQPMPQHPLTQPCQQNLPQHSEAGQFQPLPFQPSNLAGLMMHRQPDMNFAPGAWPMAADQADMQAMGLAELRSTIGQFGLPPNLKGQPLPSPLPTFQAQHQLPSATGPQPGMIQQQHAPIQQQGPTYQQSEMQPNLAMPQYPAAHQQLMHTEVPIHFQAPVAQTPPSLTHYSESTPSHSQSTASQFNPSVASYSQMQMPHPERVEPPGEPRLSPPRLPTTFGMGFENLRSVLGMQDSAEGSAPMLDQEQKEDKALLHEALADIMQLLISEEHNKSASSTQEEPPSWACIRWASMTTHCLARKRQTMLHQGRRLISHGNQLGLSQVEEQLLTYIMLDEPSWSSIFPRITHHCKDAVASKLKPLISELDSGGAKLARIRSIPPGFCPRSDSRLPQQSSVMIDLRAAAPRTYDALPSPG
eukprot:TRINITY_DN12463_c0_g1_i1.p1 TRINITY_DN12463_c0_g1~~TRINITY_DN12463_c0_g1_i1.p1  ORF type:complete len:574 (-),score=147.45 TRINITY_DN12463_c0_g1_i1:41-1597(-)